MLARQRKILLLGPSGAGKSTLCNAIYNQKVDAESLSGPAKVSARAQGVTEELTNFWCDNSLVVTDTIGFDDPRFEPEKILKELRTLLYQSQIRYEKIILCMRNGRVSKAARIYLRLLETIFDKPFTNMILYISGCEDGTTKEKFLKINQNPEDDDLSNVLKALLSETEEKKKKKINFDNIVCGTLQYHEDPEIDKLRLGNMRKDSFAKIMNGINADIGFVKIGGTEEDILKWFELLLSHFLDFFGIKKKGLELIKFGSFTSINVKYLEFVLYVFTKN